MGDSLITIVAIFLAAVLMFVFPLMSMSEQMMYHNLQYKLQQQNLWTKLEQQETLP